MFFTHVLQTAAFYNKFFSGLLFASYYLCWRGVGGIVGFPERVGGGCVCDHHLASEGHYSEPTKSTTEKVCSSER